VALEQADAKPQVAAMSDDWYSSWQGRTVRWTRQLLTGALLVTVWHHAHWSVALSLTLLALAHEATAANVWALWQRR
jgi:hypothetical protein